ncbi:hypothetical protein K523DRAFT_127683 [Schizophyllum commune Tattone D]|nr:hypothetical protein K523DRAFT_127683 [Schizophyllum commune Tattone D]
MGRSRGGADGQDGTRGGQIETRGATNRDTGETGRASVDSEEGKGLRHGSWVGRKERRRREGRNGEQNGHGKRQGEGKSLARVTGAGRSPLGRADTLHVPG